jgi:AcrR family transcriptional regulator
MAGMVSRNTSSRRSYHHGDLHTALLAEAEAILESDGIGALTLRGAAAAAGVSHAAPKNHFGNLTGLLSELAAVGYTRFAATLLPAMEAAPADPHARMVAMGRAYVMFARKHPGLFVLMFRHEWLDADRPALRDAIEAARQALRAAISAEAGKPLPPLQLAAHATAAWALVHGFSVLLLEGRLDATLKSLPRGESADSLLEAILALGA